MDELFELEFEELFEFELDELFELEFEELFELEFDELLPARMICPVSAFTALTASIVGSSGTPIAAFAPVAPIASAMAVAVKIASRFMTRTPSLGCGKGTDCFQSPKANEARPKLIPNRLWLSEA